MKFTITAEHTFSWPVKMKVPSPKSAGAKIEQKFVGQFRYLPRSEVNEIAEHYKNLTDAADREAHEHDLIRKVLIGWNDEVQGDDDEPIPFSEAALDQALEFDWFRAGVYRAYSDATIQDGGRRGN